MTDTQAILSELARVRCIFQLRTISLVIHGEHSFLNPSPLDHRPGNPDELRLADVDGVAFNHVGSVTE